MRTEEALSYVKAILPKSLIGEHAYSHWELHRRRRYSRGVPWKERLRRQEQSAIDSARFRLRRALSVDPALLGRLNAVIKSAKPFDRPRRLLLGIHDVDAFVIETFTRRPEPYGPERAATLRLVAEVENTKGGRAGRFSCLGVCGAATAAHKP